MHPSPHHNPLIQSHWTHSTHADDYISGPTQPTYPVFSLPESSVTHLTYSTSYDKTLSFYDKTSSQTLSATDAASSLVRILPICTIRERDQMVVLFESQLAVLIPKTADLFVRLSKTSSTSEPVNRSVFDDFLEQLAKPQDNTSLHSQISAYRDLPEDWDGEGGQAPSGQAIREALAFIDILPVGAKVPKASVAGDGEIGFYWRHNKDFIEISFYGDGNLYFYARVESTGVNEHGVQPYDGSSMPKILVEAIASI